MDYYYSGCYIFCHCTTVKVSYCTLVDDKKVTTLADMGSSELFIFNDYVKMDFTTGNISMTSLSLISPLKLLLDVPVV